MPSGAKIRRQEILERASGGALDHHRRQFGTAVIHPAFARLMHQRQRAIGGGQPVQCHAGRVRARRDAGLGDRPLDRGAAGRRHDHAEAAAKRQQVPQRDRARCRHGVVERTVEVPQHPAIRQFRQPALDRRIQLQHAGLDQDHHRHRRDRLSHGGDAEPAVAPHRRPIGEVAQPRHHGMDLVAARNQGGEAGHDAAGDMVRHPVGQVVEPRRPEASHRIRSSADCS
jgi:hypothetical protein